MTEITCWNCNHEWQYEKTGNFPCGPCPVYCPKCNTECCPDCGGELDSEDEDEDVQMYCGDGCDCGYRHCGGCI